MSEPISINVAVQATQEPVLASPTTGDASPIDLNFVITYPGKPSTSVSVSRVEIEIPFGDDARALSANKSSISTAIAIDPSWGWGTWRQDTGYDRGFAFTTEDDGAISFTNEHSLQFTLKNVIINREAGIVEISVTLSVKEGIQKIKTATGQTKLSKTTDGFFLKMTTDAKNDTIHLGDSITLSWVGSSKANYKLYIDDEPVIKDGLPPVGNYVIPKELIPKRSFNVTLEASVTIFGKTVNYSRTRRITVKLPSPEITSFEGGTQMVGGKLELTLKWDTKYADSCTITGDPHPVNPREDGYKIIPSVENPLRDCYTLTANNDEGTVSKTLLLTWQASPFPISSVYCPTSLCMTPDGSCLFVVDGLDDTVTEINVQKRQVQNPPISSVYCPTSLCMTPDSSCLFVANGEDNTVTEINVQKRQVQDPPIRVGGGPTSLCMTPDGSRLFVANEEDNTVTEINVQKRQVQDPPIRVGGGPISLCMTPDGSRLFVVNEEDNTVTEINVQKRQVQDPPIRGGGDRLHCA